MFRVIGPRQIHIHWSGSCRISGYQSSGAPAVAPPTKLALVPAASIGETYAGLVCRKIFRVARYEQTILSNRARPDDRVGKLEPIFASQLDCFFCYLRRQRHDAKMSKKSAPDIFIGLGPCASHYLHP